MAGFYASYPPIGGGGGGGGSVVAAGVAALSSGASSFSITYDVTLGSSIPPVFSFVNSVDASPIFLIGYVSAYSTSGFTVTANAQTDTANYKIVYIVSGAV